jgi:RimJ/RimL family protein N-acetyltransferase
MPTDGSAGPMADSLDIGYALIPEFQRRGIAKSALLAFLAKILTP